MLLALALAAAQTPEAGTPPAAPPALATYERAVADATASVKAALPRLVTCQRPAAQKLVLKVDLAAGARVTTAALGPSGGTKVSAPCIEKVVQDVFTRARPAVGREAAVVLDTTATLRLEGDVALFGALGNDAIEEGIRARMDLVAQCYVVGLAEAPGLAGEVAVAFTVLPDGRVHAPEIKRTQLWNPTVEACILRQVATATFPPPDGGAIVRVTYPFTFNPPSDAP